MVDKRYFETKLAIPETCKIELVERIIKVTGPKGIVERNIKNKLLQIELLADKIIFYSVRGTKNHKKIVLTFVAHTKNMLKGAVEGHVYKLKVCSGHFPMTAAVKGNMFEVKNLFGESKSRLLKLIPDVTVKVNVTEITVEGTDKEKVGQTAASIESLTKRPNFDKRIFQDGIYITSKDGKSV